MDLEERGWTRADWVGPGWYAPEQVGSHEEAHREYVWVGDGEGAPDTYRMGLGTPVWWDGEDWWELED